ncbi:hypothetical protein E2C01_085289 [Portunus trituberculatus]|uniref:Uncharacterized protein n=1 Tax=Portunus trituberculatus TaxID=210409 RepID=A0A5B7J292_PORTR|nr:hypothetical protein [Portunus trituberculatus]
MSGLFEEDPHESAPYGGGTHAELSPGLAAGCPGIQSRPQLGELDHSDGATAEGSEVASSAGELDPPVSAECAGGEELLAPLPGDCPLEDSLGDGPVSVAGEGGSWVNATPAASSGCRWVGTPTTTRTREFACSPPVDSSGVGVSTARG